MYNLKEVVILKTGLLRFNPENERFGITSMDLWENEGLHCGDPVTFYDFSNEKWVETRIEMKFPYIWYLVGTDLHGMDLDGLRVLID